MGTDFTTGGLQHDTIRELYNRVSRSLRLRVPSWFYFFKFAILKQTTPINYFGNNHKFLECITYNNIWGEYVS